MMKPKSVYEPDELVDHARSAYGKLCSLEGKKALVIGAGDLGAGAAIGMAVAGADVAVANRTGERAVEVACAIEMLGRRSTALEVDVTRSSSVDEMFSVAMERLDSRLDIVVLAFGANRRQRAEELSDEGWHEVVSTNLTGVFLCCRRAYPILRENHGGRLIIVASAAAHVARAWPPTAAYGASKAGATHLARFLAVEWARHAITVNAISPGYFKTRLTAPLVSDDEALRSLLTLTPMARLGTLDEFIGPLIFLASDASGFMTGQTLIVDGGRVVV